MNYQRYNRRYTPSRNNPPKGKYGEVIIIAILLGVAAYFITAGIAGQWIADNVLGPFLSAPQKSEAPIITPSATTPAEKNEEETSPAPSPTSSSGSAVTEDMEIAGFTIYSLQLGAFGTKENADVQAESVQKRGGAGYIITDGDLSRVIAAAYNNQDDAKLVKEALAQQASIDSSIYSINAGAVSLSVTADKERIETLKDGFSAYLGVKDKMSEISMQYDSDADNDALTKAITEQKEALTQRKEALKDLKDTNNAIVPQMEKLIDDAIEQLDKVLKAPDDKEARSSILKFAHISIINNYVDFVNKINESG